MDKLKLNNGDKIFIQNRVHVVAARVMNTVYVKVSLCQTNDYNYTEDEVMKNYKIEFLKEK